MHGGGGGGGAKVLACLEGEGGANSFGHVIFQFFVATAPLLPKINYRIISQLFVIFPSTPSLAHAFVLCADTEHHGVLDMEV